MSRIEASSVVPATEFVPFDPDAAADAAGVGVSAWMGFGRLLGLYARVAGVAGHLKAGSFANSVKVFR
jgi:hypothetical protein